MNELSKWKMIIWVLCYLSMTSRHLMLESWYMTKPILNNNSLISTNWLSLIDSIYLLTYALGNIISGFFEDQYSLRLLLSIGLFSSALLYWMIIILGLTQTYSPFLFILLWFLQGIFQSSVYPGCISLLGHWFGKSNRGKVMGLFSSSSSAGNFLGAFISGWLLSAGYSWMALMAAFSIFEAFIAILIFFFVRDSPEAKFGKKQKKMLMVSLNEVNEESYQLKHKKKGIPFLQALRIPNIINFAIAMACAKFLVYALNMWLPFYLDGSLDKSQYVGILAGLFDIGAIIGSVVCGWAGDKISSRPPVMFLFLTLSFPCLLFFALSGNNGFWILFVLIPCTGFFLGGVNLILGSAVPVDLAQNKSIQNTYEAMATVAGIIDGSGGLGASIGVFVVGQLSAFSWSYVFIFMISMAVVEFLALFRISVREIRKVRRNFKNNAKV